MRGYQRRPPWFVRLVESFVAAEVLAQARELAGQGWEKCEEACALLRDSCNGVLRVDTVQRYVHWLRTRGRG